MHVMHDQCRAAQHLYLSSDDELELDEDESSFDMLFFFVLTQSFKSTSKQKSEISNIISITVPVSTASRSCPASSLVLDSILERKAGILVTTATTTFFKIFSLAA